MEERPYPYKHWLGSTLAGAFIGWAAPKLLDFFWPQVFASLAALPIETGVLGAVTASLGFMAGLYAGRRSRKPGKPTRRERKAAEEAKETREREGIERSLQQFKHDCSGEAKAMAACIYRLPGHRAAVNAIGKAQIEAYARGSGTSSWLAMFEFDDKGDGIFYAELDKWVAELFDARPELLADFPSVTLDWCKQELGRWDPF